MPNLEDMSAEEIIELNTKIDQHVQSLISTKYNYEQPCDCQSVLMFDLYIHEEDSYFPLVVTVCLNCGGIVTI